MSETIFIKVGDEVLWFWDVLLFRWKEKNGKFKYITFKGWLAILAQILVTPLLRRGIPERCQLRRGMNVDWLGESQCVGFKSVSYIYRYLSQHKHTHITPHIHTIWSMFNIFTKDKNDFQMEFPMKHALWIQSTGNFINFDHYIYCYCQG